MFTKTQNLLIPDISTLCFQLLVFIISASKEAHLKEAGWEFKVTKGQQNNQETAIAPIKI